MFFKKNPEKEKIKQERKQKELEFQQRKQEIKEENKRRKIEFKKTKSYIGISVDEVSESFKLDFDFFKVFKFDELVEYTLIENGHSLTQGGVSLKRAAAGGILLGGVGAVLGGLSGKKKVEDLATEIKIEFRVTGINEGNYTISLLDKPIKKDSLTYKGLIANAKDIITFFDKISNVE